MAGAKPKKGYTVADLVRAGTEATGGYMRERYGATGPTGAIEVGAPEDEMQWPDEIDVDDLELVKKEWWLVGYWAKEHNPGFFEVYKEPTNHRLHPVNVAGYTKPWHSKTWRRSYPRIEEDDG